MAEKIKDDEKFEVTFKIIKEKYVLEVSKTESIGTVKQKLAEKLKETTSQCNQNDLKFIYAGRLLQDSQTVSECQIHANSEVFVTCSKLNVKASKSAKHSEHEKQQQTMQSQSMQAAPSFDPMSFSQQPFQNANASSLFGGFNANMLNDAGQNELLRQQFQSYINNPRLIDSMMPQQFQNRSEAEKETMRQMFVNQFKLFLEKPDALNSMLQSLGNIDPATMQSVLAGVDPSAIGTLNMQYPNPYASAAQQSPYTNPMSMNTMNNMNTVNPMNPYQQYVPSPTIPCFHGFVPPAYVATPQSPLIAPSTAVDPKKVFEKQLKTLSEMGFSNEDLNLKALRQANGDLSLATEYLFQWLNNPGNK
ncbi:hypothetical protein EDEG_02362 [Edhazardia aedis USNM 41457]|uniref:UBA domain-containing protein n=1 Tax=Edhazardia aedis (strain USNM 41457) TaxID=1003232 RepID=J9D676_EDHAE|nr:hypothetical protein EDEG_02362 [Edhazardia aedis USNM 41457]|eukprot:EJW03296.1 hypothetical protein EDEG_02362 [Edhazardia aedis USNM 41457]